MKKKQYICPQIEIMILAMRGSVMVAGSNDHGSTSAPKRREKPF